LNIGGVFANNLISGKQDVRFKVRFRGLDLPVTTDTLVSHNADDWVMADDRALQIGNLHLVNLCLCISKFTGAKGFGGTDLTILSAAPQEMATSKAVALPQRLCAAIQPNVHTDISPYQAGPRLMHFARIGSPPCCLFS